MFAQRFGRAREKERRIRRGYPRLSRAHMYVHARVSERDGVSGSGKGEGGGGAEKEKERERSANSRVRPCGIERNLKKKKGQVG